MARSINSRYNNVIEHFPNIFIVDSCDFPLLRSDSSVRVPARHGFTIWTEEALHENAQAAFKTDGQGLVPQGLAAIRDADSAGDVLPHFLL
jgi:hypothetical protein